MDATQEAARKRILTAIKITEIPATPLAKKAGIAPSTLNRFLNQEVKHTLSAKTLAKVDTFVRNWLNSQPFTPETIAKELEYFGGNTEQSLVPVDADIINVSIRGAVQAGHWTEATEWPPTDWKRIALPRPDGHKSYFGLTVRGESMNQIYPEGTTLICVPMLDYHHGLTTGDHVIVQRWDGDLVEATVKELRQTDNGDTWLWPRSDHPEHQTPIQLPKNGKDHPEYEGNKDIRVTAVVVADYRIRKRH